MIEDIAKLPFGTVQGEWYESNLYIHFIYTDENFSLANYKELLFTWDVIMQGLSDTGLTNVFACISKDNIKTNKFTRLFGFIPHEETESFTIYRMDL